MAPHVDTTEGASSNESPSKAAVWLKAFGAVRAGCFRNLRTSRRLNPGDARHEWRRSLVGWAKAHRAEQRYLARTIMRLCPRCPTSPLDRVGKVARGQRAISSATAGDFAHPTTLPYDRNAL